MMYLNVYKLLGFFVDLFVKSLGFIYFVVFIKEVVFCLLDMLFWLEFFGGLGLWGFGKSLVVLKLVIFICIWLLSSMFLGLRLWWMIFFECM